MINEILIAIAYLWLIVLTLHHYQVFRDFESYQYKLQAPRGKELKMSPHELALLIQHYAAEALEGIQSTDATAYTEHRLIDIEALARDIAKDLQPVQDESSEPTGP